MKILLIAANYTARNVGDVAMRIVTARRLHELFPRAEIKIVSDDLHLFSNQFPGEIPLSYEGRKAFLRSRLFPLKGSWLPKGARERVERLEDALRENSPLLAYRLARMMASFNRVDREALDTFMTELFRSDIVVMAGCGAITDAFPSSVRAEIGLLKIAQTLGKPCAMFGQGLGPLELPANQRRVAPVFAGLDLLALREKRAGIPLLQRIGVPLDRVEVTGDDAIELAYEQRQERVGTKLGFNLRVTDYSAFPPEAVASIREVLTKTLAERKTSLVPLPVYVKQSPEGDLENIARVCEGIPLDPPIEDRVVTPLDLIRRVAGCRVVVTGSYHSGVFALSQGIPVIGLARSHYYRDKFEGLADQFPGGCDVLYLDNPDLGNQLDCAIRKRWETADQTRDSLLASAKKQVELSRAAYARFAGAVRAKIAVD